MIIKMMIIFFCLVLCMIEGLAALRNVNFSELIDFFHCKFCIYKQLLEYIKYSIKRTIKT